MGYVVTPQASSKISPYQALFAVPPIIPPSIRERLTVPLDMDDPDLAAQNILLRAAILQKAPAITGHNLLVQQHQDTKRYARLRSAGYHPRLRAFSVGDYVYVDQYKGQAKPPGLELHPRLPILRIQEVRATGVLVLVGSCGITVCEHASHCSPCHLNIVDPLPINRGQPGPDLTCSTCDLPFHKDTLLLCDNCNKGFHLKCLSLTSSNVPKGSWYCSACIALGFTPAPSPVTVPVHRSSPHHNSLDLSRHATVPVTSSPSIQHPPLATTVPVRRLESLRPTKAAKALAQDFLPSSSTVATPTFNLDFWNARAARLADGTTIHKSFQGVTYHGIVKYLGTRHRPYAFQINYPDDVDVETMCLDEVLFYQR